MKRLWKNEDVSRKIAYFSYEISRSVEEAVVATVKPFGGMSNVIFRDNNDGKERHFYTPLSRDNEKHSRDDLKDRGDWCFIR